MTQLGPRAAARLALKMRRSKGLCSPLNWLVTEAWTKEKLECSHAPETDMEHHRQADDLGTRLEPLEGAGFGHCGTLAGALSRLKPGFSDRACRADHRSPLGLAHSLFGPGAFPVLPEKLPVRRIKFPVRSRREFWLKPLIRLVKTRRYRGDSSRNRANSM